MVCTMIQKVVYIIIYIIKRKVVYTSIYTMIQSKVYTIRYTMVYTQVYTLVYTMIVMVYTMLCGYGILPISSFVYTMVYT